MANPPVASDFRDSRPVWMLDLTWGGRVYRVATEPVTVVGDDDANLSYVGGLEEPTRLRETLGRLKTDPGEASASLSLYLATKVSERVMDGYDLMAATATLYLGTVARGGYWRDAPELQQKAGGRWHQISGKVRRPRFGFPGEDHPPYKLEVTIQEEPWQAADRPILGAGAILNAEQTTAWGDDSIGKVIPLCFGYPGPEGEIPGAPAYSVGALTDIDGTAVALGAVINYGRVLATSVRSFDRDLSSGGQGDRTFNVGHANLNGGLTVAYINTGAIITGTAQVPAWTLFDQGGGSTPSPYSSGVLTDSAEVAAYVLERGGASVDVRRWLALKGRGTFKVDTYINDPEITASEWLDDAGLLEAMSVTVRRNEQGLYPVPYDPHVYYDEVVASVEEGNGWTAASGVDVAREPEDLLNAATVSFQLSGETEEYARVLHFEEPAGSIYRSHATHATRTSVARYGRISRDLSFPAISRKEEAQFVASRFLNLRALPSYLRTYLAPWWYGFLSVGDTVRITDSGAAWTNVVATINGRKWTGFGWEFELLVDESLIRDSRA